MGNCSSTETSMGAATTPRTISDKELDSKREKIPFFKLVVVGDVSAGKSAIIGAIGGKGHPLKRNPTKEPAITNFEYTLSESMKVGIILNEIPAHASSSMKRRHYRDLDGSIVVVDLSQPMTVELCGSWKRDIVMKASESKPLGGLKSSSPRSPKVSTSPRRPKPKSPIASEDSYIFSSSDGATSDTDLEILSGIKQKGFPILLVGSKLDLAEKIYSEGDLHLDEDQLKPDIVSQLQRLSLSNDFWDCVTYTPRDKVVLEKFHQKIRAFFNFLLQRRASLHLQKSLANSQHPDLPTNRNDIQLIKQGTSDVPPLTSRSANSNSRNEIAGPFPDDFMARKSDIKTEERSSRTSQEVEQSIEVPDVGAIMTPKQRPSNPQHQFAMTGLVDHDRYLLQTEHMIARVADMTVRFEKAKVRFSEVCFENSVTTSQGATIMDCLTCIRDQTDLTSKITIEVPKEVGCNDNPQSDQVTTSVVGNLSE